VINMMLIAYIDYMATHDEAYFDQFVNWFLKSGLISSIQLECAYFLLSVFWVAEACDDEKEETNAEVETNPETTPETNPEAAPETNLEVAPETNPEINPVSGQTGGEANVGNKIEYVMGNATGSKHNIERSLEMEKTLNSIGIYDNEEGREIVLNAFQDAYSNLSDGIVKENGRITVNTLLLGPNGCACRKTIWEGNKLITVNIFKSGWNSYFEKQ
ncbi:MAG: hypothetical protein IIY49_09840, partial [Eubacterium sp.]|nr:hypothetical protein [Eubacterium sp.]